jgi:NAD(P)-dependent dehydrogenase (short-subunit alcohol dehydrogenase family)
VKLESLNQFAHERKLPLEAIEFDVCDDASVEKGIAEIERRAGPVDILVNNAGIAIAAMMEEITLDDLRKQFETNFVRRDARHTPRPPGNAPAPPRPHHQYELDQRQSGDPDDGAVRC